ncbi:ABC transporter ATP-binding protein [Cupriavidus plantarum]|uniref:Peptide/nickel transport system ATP-binding protein n=1 Tax=Cupriavidus plantarum TaxID=942865 RepID=A0A316F0U9_9BURK|nr:ABC transporter ATP-binding protein [Cupriavidus plantarum]PWK37113.1 peptide/nickel transport system ATP-binding protein [Cupriavidus plantarum]RLK45004.1 peptide/nickel transport system ATP-binding protein [Cupriavidus plantarum]CAG2130125.1 Oligopeptide transport ATP-binding protein OppD [Cupriavidus plantarum]SMR66196.1 peptide/nickel transport system ATP-binding protein [Cupriavidus plantarum]
MSETQTSVAAPVVSVRDLHVSFHGSGKTIQAVNGVSLTVNAGESLALIGESGSGKSVTLRALMRLHPPRRTRMEGEIRVDGEDVLAMDKRALSRLRGGKVAMVFQEPLLALDPVYTVGQQIVECIRTHAKVTKAEARERALKALESVRIPSPERRLAAYPHEMSGGMRQRAMIALALSAQPKILLADEPTTALDATVQIQVLILMRELQRELGLSIVFVTHDIGAAVEIADRVAVMYGGRIVEEGPIRTLMREARHPYTNALLKSRQHGMSRGERLETIGGAPPDLSALPPGCTFAPRCAHARPECLKEVPRAVSLGNGHRVSCVLVSEPAAPATAAA